MWHSSGWMIAMGWDHFIFLQRNQNQRGGAKQKGIEGEKGGRGRGRFHCISDPFKCIYIKIRKKTRHVFQCHSWNGSGQAFVTLNINKRTQGSKDAHAFNRRRGRVAVSAHRAGTVAFSLIKVQNSMESMPLFQILNISLNEFQFTFTWTD